MVDLNTGTVIRIDMARGVGAMRIIFCIFSLLFLSACTATESNMPTLAKIPTELPTQTPLPSPTNTQIPEPSATITNTPTVPFTVYHISIRVSVRSCKSITCDFLGIIEARNTVNVIDISSDGWYSIILDDDQIGFIYPGSSIRLGPPPTLYPTQDIISVPTINSNGSTCGGKTTCSQMSSCSQAYACLRAGRTSLDRDKDGVPCESICGG